MTLILSLLLFMESHLHIVIGNRQMTRTRRWMRDENSCHLDREGGLSNGDFS